MDKHTDTCDWCGKQTTKLQMKPGAKFGLCPEHCPDIDDPSSVPENAPTIWYNMDEDERSDWKNGLSLDKIMDKYNWMARH